MSPALIKAVQTEDFQHDERTACVELLLAHKANVNATCDRGWTALMWASRHGHLDCMRALLEHGADVNVVTERDGFFAIGTTALIGAVKGHAEKDRRTACVELLLAHKANVNETSNDGCTALMWAAHYGHLDCMRALLKHGADVNAAADSGATALMWAARRYKMKGKGSIDPAVVDLLLRNGAEVNAADKKGKTALYYAVGTHSRTECFRSLLKYGANPDLQATKGYTPRELAPTVIRRLEREIQASAPKAAPVTDRKCARDSGAKRRTKKKLRHATTSTLLKSLTMSQGQTTARSASRAS